MIPSAPEISHPVRVRTSSSPASNTSCADHQAIFREQTRNGDWIMILRQPNTHPEPQSLQYLVEPKPWLKASELVRKGDPQPAAEKSHEVDSVNAPASPSPLHAAAAAASASVVDASMVTALDGTATVPRAAVATAAGTTTSRLLSRPLPSPRPPPSLQAPGAESRDYGFVVEYLNTHSVSERSSCASSALHRSTGRLRGACTLSKVSRRIVVKPTGGGMG